MITTKKNGVMNTGKITIGVTATGYITRTDTTAFGLCGGTRGGGIGIGGDVAGVITGNGISITADSMLCGTTQDAGGGDRGTAAGCNTVFPIRTMYFG